jgi:cyclic beta-1,2-glucan synthetase
VQHGWHTLESEENVRHIGVRTTCSDDYMWLVWAVGEYVRATGDRSILYEEVAYLSSKPLESGEHERYEWVCVTETKESVLEHCARAAELFIKRGVGAHGLPLVLGGDWNDSMNRMGEKGRGESVWLAWFGALSLKRFAELLEEGERRERYSEYAKKLVLAAENVYNGEWYPRGYDDGGLPVGSPENEECKIDSISQSFAVFAGADRGRARRALENALKALVDDENRIIKLFSPPFEKREGMGYIASYPPGVRENGGQYTHAAIWMASACFKAGMAEWGYKLLDMLLPQNRDPAKYRVEPFVLAADVYSQPPLAGQGGWSWYTGAAGWYRETVINDLLGITLRGGRLFIKPNIPSDWPGFECAIRYGGALYQISVSRGAKQSKGIEEGILLIDDGEIHEITVSV